MDAFAADVVHFVDEWPSWHVISVDETARIAVLRRTDDFLQTIEIRAPAQYPLGRLALRQIAMGDCTAECLDSYEAPSQMSVSDAVDAALLWWSEKEYARDRTPLGCTALHGTPSAAEMGDDSSEVSHVSESSLVVQRVLQLWRFLTLGTSDCHVMFRRQPSTIELHVAISVRDLDPLLCLALSLADREFFLVVIHMPLSFPWDPPKVVEVVMSNDPGAFDSGANCMPCIGPLVWLVKQRLTCYWDSVVVELRRMEMAGGTAEPVPVFQDHEESVLTAPVTAAKSARWILREVLLGSSDEIFELQARRLALDDSASNPLLLCRTVLLHILNNSTSHCFVCCSPLDVDGMKMATCGNELCTFAVEEMGLGVDVLVEVALFPEVFELLMVLAHASCSHGDKRDCFEPMCNVNLSGSREWVMYSGPKHFFLNGMKNAEGGRAKNFRLLLEIIQLVPSTVQIISTARGSGAALKKRFDAIHPLVFPFVKWLVSSNRSHIQFIPPACHIRGLGNHQFLVINHNPTKERRFQRLRQQSEHQNGVGSFFAWHGSGTYNWHCILREGLKAYSGTKFMSTGQIYGAGIYLARQVMTSVSYMAVSRGSWSGCTKINAPQGCFAIALCEVVGDPQYYKEPTSDIVMVTDEDAVCTRFLFVLPAQTVSTASLAQLPSNDVVAAQLKGAFPLVFRDLSV